MILKTSNRNVWSNVFWYVKVCIFWMCIQYTIHWDKTQMLTKFSSDKINGSKNALFFLSPAPIYYSFTFSLKLCAELSIFDSVLCFIIVYIFVQQHAWILWLYNVVIPIKIKIIKKPHTVLLPVLWFLSCNKKF